MKTAKSAFGRKLTVEQWLACVGAGWHDLVRPLVEYCSDHDLPIFQIKEKFGGLRFYSLIDDTLVKMIDDAEKLSYQICDECGAPGKLRRGGWLRTLCDEHVEGREPYIEPST